MTWAVGTLWPRSIALFPPLTSAVARRNNLVRLGSVQYRLAMSMVGLCCPLSMSRQGSVAAAIVSLLLWLPRHVPSVLYEDKAPSERGVALNRGWDPYRVGRILG